MALHIIIIAGGGLPPELYGVSEARVKALLRVGAGTLLEHAVAAVAGSPLVGDIAVVGGDNVLRAMMREAAYVESGKTAIDNLYRGFVHHGASLDDEFLVLSPDLPFVTAAALERFIAAARVAGEMAFPVVSAEDFLARFPGAPNKFERLDGVPATMGSSVYMTGRMLKTNIPLFHDFFRSRRAPHRLAALMGLPIALAYLTGRTRLAQLEARASRLTGGKVRAVPGSDPALAFDIDKLADYDYALRHLQGLRGG